MQRSKIRAWMIVAAGFLTAVSLVIAVPASADPPYLSGAPFNGNPISPGLGPTYGEAWCASAAGENVPQTSPLADIPYAAIGCTLAKFQTEAANAGVPTRMSYSIIGQSAGGRDLYGVVVNALETPEQQRDYEHWQNVRAIELTDPAAAQALVASYGDEIKIPIYVENNIHGDEREGTDAMMQTLRDLVTLPRGTNSYVDALLDHAILITVPTENPDGRVLGQRANANNFDMNRDWLVQSQSEVQAERDLIQEWIPTVGLATHGYVNPTLIDGLTKPHNPGIEYDLFAKWNERRLDANQTALAGIAGAPLGITRPRGANGLTGFTAYCSAGSAVTTTCNTNNTISASPAGLTESGTTVTVTTTAALTINHTPGAQVTITNAANAAYNGTWTITSTPTSTSYTFTHTTSGLSASGGGTSAPKPGPANAEGWDDWGPFYTQTYLAFMGPDSSTLEMCNSGTNCNGRFGSKRAQYVGFWSSADYWVTHRQDMIHDQLEIFRRGVADESRVPCCTDPLLIARGWLPQQQDWSVEYPKAYVIPFNGGGQRSNGEANRMAQWLLDNGIQVERMDSDFTWGSTTFPAGSYVVSMAQALRGLAYTTLAAGQDISQRITQLYAPPGAWSHGLLWGADTVEIPRADATFTPATTLISAVNALSSVGGVRDGVLAPSDFYAAMIRGTSDFHAIQDLLHAGFPAEMAEGSFVSTTGGTMPAGTLLFKNDPTTAAALDAAGKVAGLAFERNVGVIKPPVSQVARAPRVAILVNSANPARSDTSETLKAIFGADARFLSLTTSCATCAETSIANATTDPLLNYDVIYNTGQAYPGAGTARTRLNAFFQRGGGYIATSQSTTGFTFMTAVGNALVPGAFTGASSAAGGGIARWSNTGGSTSPISGGYPGEDFLYLPSNVTYFSATPTGAVIDGRYRSDMGGAGGNGPTGGFVAGLWRTRATATNNAPVLVHGTLQTPYTGRYMGLATNPFSRQDGEREWPAIEQAALWANVTDEPTSAIDFPVEGTTYGHTSYNAGCSTAAGDFCGTAAATAGPGLDKVKIAIQRAGNGKWWDGAAFTSTDPVYANATGTSNWSFSFPVTNFVTDGDYAVRSKAVDLGGNEQVQTADATFTIARLPAVSRTSGPATQTVQYSDATTSVGIGATDPDSTGASLSASASYVYTQPGGCGGPCPAPVAGLPSGLTLSGPTNNGATIPGTSSWTVSGNATAQAGSYDITVTVADEQAATGSTSFTVVVDPEDAQLLYNGSDVIPAGTNPTLSAQVWDSAGSGYSGSNPEPGGTIGDITKIWVRFDVKTCIGDTPVSGSPKYAQVVDTGTIGDGIGIASIVLNTTSNTDTTWCVTSTVVANGAGGTNRFYTATMDQTGVIALYQNSGQFVTGGGTIPDGSKKANFGLVTRYNKKGKAQGQVVYSWRGTYAGGDATFKVKSNAMTGLSFSGKTYPISATIAGGANISIMDDKGNVLFSEGNWRFTATVADKDVSPGAGNDSLTIKIWDKNNQLYRSVPVTLLSGGNVTVKNP